MANYTTPETGRARHYYRSVEGRRGADRLFYEATMRRIMREGVRGPLSAFGGIADITNQGRHVRF
jgi:hypothetical protein